MDEYIYRQINKDKYSVKINKGDDYQRKKAYEEAIKIVFFMENGNIKTFKDLELELIKTAVTFYGSATRAASFLDISYQALKRRLKTLK